MSDALKLSQAYVDFVDKVKEDTNIEKIAEDYRNNLLALRASILEISNTISNFMNDGQFIKVEMDATYPGTTVDFYIDTKLGHSIYIALHTDVPAYISVSHQDNVYAVTMNTFDLEKIINILKNYNNINVTFTDGTELFKTYLPQVEKARENE